MNNSPGKNVNSLLFHEPTDSFAHKYLANFGQSHEPHFGGDPLREHLECEIDSLNNTLNHLLPDKLTLGDVFSQEMREITKTIDVVKCLVSHKQKDMETKNDLHLQLRKSESERNQMQTQIQKLQRDLKKIETQRDNLLLKGKNNEKIFKENIDKLTSEKDDYAKRYKAIEARQNQYKNEYRKFEATIKTLQEKLNRGQDKSNFKNNFELMQNLQSTGPSIVMMNAQHEYNQIVAKTMQDSFLQITKQNQYLKDCLQSIQKELQSVLDLKRQILKRRRGYDSEYDSVFDLKQFKSELLNLPQQFSRQGINNLNQNVSRFRQAMKLGQNLDDRQADQKIACVSNVKNLIRNYKNVVESQEQLLTKVILKAKDFKNSEMQALQNRYNKGVEQDQIERAKKFLEEQSSYLEGKNRQLELTRKAMQTTIRKVELEREEYIKKAGQTNDEINRVRKQVQMLPSLVEQELSTLQ